jgi:predicted HTH domain antitoxin
MAITIELPSDVEQRLRAESPNLDAEAKESLLVELYRQEKLTRREFSLALGVDRYETEAILKRHRVTIDLPTPQEIETELAHLRGIIQR